MISTLSFFVLCAALLVRILLFFIRRWKDLPIPEILYGLSGLLLLVELVRRSILIGFPAVTNMYESLMLITALILLLCVIYRFQKSIQYIPAISFASAFLAFVFLALVSSPLIPGGVHPPVPALQSSWLVLHVSLSFIGEAFFAVAFFSSIYYIAVSEPEKKKAADAVTARCISIGYPIFTAGALVFGAVWAQAAWGRYWSWDPKETWALITWLVYTAYLHARYVGKFRGRITALLSIAGFLLALFTFFGVNYLISGLHSYK